MFTGLVETQATIDDLVAEGAGRRLIIQRPPPFDDCQIGDSIAVNGCCLTIVEMSDRHLSFQAGEETLSRTNLGRLTVGSKVNLERAMRLSDRVGGHLVTGMSMPWGRSRDAWTIAIGPSFTSMRQHG